MSKNERHLDGNRPIETSLEGASCRSVIQLILRLPVWAYGVLLGAACVSPNVKVPPDTQPHETSSVAEAPLLSFDHLLLKLPTDIRARIEELLERGFHSDTPLFTDDPYLLGQDKTTKDCFGTMFWVLSGDAEESPMKGIQLVRKLTELGYQKELDFPSYAESTTGTFPSPDLEAMKRHLLPGDVLIFMSPPLWDNASMARMMPLERNHAALYLGAVDGYHAIFQKPDPKCGPMSPYEITTMQKLLDDGMSRAVYTTTAVWRR